MNVAVAKLDHLASTPIPRVRPTPMPVRSREELAKEFDYLLAVLHPLIGVGCERSHTEVIGYCTKGGEGPTRERTGNVTGWKRTDFGCLKIGEFETYDKAIDALHKAVIDKT